MGWMGQRTNSSELEQSTYTYTWENAHCEHHHPCYFPLLFFGFSAHDSTQSRPPSPPRRIETKTKPKQCS